MKAEYVEKQREYEEKKARAKALQLRLTCTICGAKPKTLLNCPCRTTQYCSTDCQRIDWRDRGHRKACKKIRAERPAEAARAEAPPSPPKPVFYGPAPRSHADEVRTRIATEHEAARLRREANPEPEPTSVGCGSRCPICLEDWDVNMRRVLRVCCCRTVCQSCEDKIGTDCPFCRLPRGTGAEALARLRRHVENEVPEAIAQLGIAYHIGHYGLVKSDKKAAKIWKRGVELGNVLSMIGLAGLYEKGDGVKMNVKKAKQLLTMAADRGHAIAQCNLGLLHGEDNQVEALRLFKRSADQGLLSSMHMVGFCYQNGFGAEADLEAARRWYELAAAGGNELSTAKLAELDAP